MQQMDKPTIGRIHVLENDYYRALWNKRRAGEQVCIGNSWTDASRGVFRDFALVSGALWPKNTPDSFKSQQRENFRRMCYPIAVGILQKKYSDPSAHDIQWIHECDDLIFLSEKCKINYETGTHIGALTRRGRA